MVERQPRAMAWIQRGVCVSHCLSMEVDPLFISPAALAKAYRFVGDPHDAPTVRAPKDLAEDPHGIYDCTHCFNCIEACPKGVAPMSQIMRLRRIAGSDHHIKDRNNGQRHERAFVKNIEKNGLLHEADLLPDSYGGKFHPRAIPVLIGSLPSILPALLRGKVTPKKALLHQHKAPKDVRRIFEQVHAKDERYELEPLRRGQGRGPPGRGGQPRYRTGRTGPRHASVRAGRVEPEPRMKVAYWPGCVSRGFTPELHGSMAKVAPLLDIELVELDRACCGAGVIAEHNQELADTLNARTFALAQQEMANGADLMMNICSTCQGAQSECQERLDANAEYRERVNQSLAPEAELREGHRQQALPVADGRGDRARRHQGEGPPPADRSARRPLLRVLHHPADRPGGHRRGAPARPVPGDAHRGARRDRGRLRGRAASAAASPSSR